MKQFLGFYFKFEFDLAGHWITNQKGNKHSIWIYLGTEMSKDNLKCVNLIVGPAKLSVIKWIKH